MKNHKTLSGNRASTGDMGYRYREQPGKAHNNNEKVTFLWNCTFIIYREFIRQKIKKFTKMHSIYYWKVLHLLVGFLWSNYYTRAQCSKRHFVSNVTECLWHIDKKNVKICLHLIIISNSQIQAIRMQIVKSNSFLRERRGFTKFFAS